MYVLLQHPEVRCILAWARASAARKRLAGTQAFPPPPSAFAQILQASEPAVPIPQLKLARWAEHQVEGQSLAAWAERPVDQ